MAVGGVGLVEVVQVDQRQGQRVAMAAGPCQLALDQFVKAAAVERPGQRIAARQERQFPLRFVALGDDAHDPVGARRAAVHAPEPAAAIFHPDSIGSLVAAFGDEPVQHFIAHAAAWIAVLGLHHRLVAGGGAVGRETAGEGGSGADVGCGINPQDLADIGPPDDRVGEDVPIIDDLSDGIENLARIGRRDRWRPAENHYILAVG